MYRILSVSSQQQPCLINWQDNHYLYRLPTYSNIGEKDHTYFLHYFREINVSFSHLVEQDMNHEILKALFPIDYNISLIKGLTTKRIIYLNYAMLTLHITATILLV